MQIGHNKGIGSHNPAAFKNKCTVEINREFKYKINMLKRIVFGICVTCLAEPLPTHSRTFETTKTTSYHAKRGKKTNVDHVFR